MPKYTIKALLSLALLVADLINLLLSKAYYYTWQTNNDPQYLRWYVDSMVAGGVLTTLTIGAWVWAIIGIRKGK